MSALPVPRIVDHVVLGGLAFPEAPRWHDGRLWFSDMHANQVVSVSQGGDRRTELELTDDEPSGLGWMPDGTLLVVAMRTRRVLRVASGGSPAVHADLFELAPCHCNDMVVDAVGRAYVGNFGFDLHFGGTPALTNVIAVAPDGSITEAATDMAFPNGTVITPDGRTMIVGESGSGLLTAFDVADDGSLSNRRVWAALPTGCVPDGICLDADGAIWSACPRTGSIWRMAEGGAVLDHLKVDLDQQAFACMLGGDDGRTLYICASGASHPERCREQRSGRILALRVDAPAAGLP